MDPGMNQLLKWSIENTDVSQSDPTSTTDPKASRPSGRPINADALKALFGGPSDAELMKQSMAAILSPDVPLEEKLVAFDNFEQLIEIIDNANNLDSLGLWTPLIGLLAEKAPDLRRMAAWCLGTAVQNNVKGQDRLLALNAIPILVKLAVEDPNEPVRRKAVYAISSEMRNYQPAADEVVKVLPEDLRLAGKVDAGSMDAIDGIVDRLRQINPEKDS
ncbi:hsp70 nucleotide exchange factor fes1 [Loxospora ochrophaea]|nr:hsp70 nucleotide exchange factor fes1 [Loxospora ochrophaea]